MKKLISLLFCLVLTSCIDVDNFGLLWDEGAVDPRLEGTWLTMDANGKPNFNSDRWKLTRQVDGYTVEMQRKKEEADSEVQKLRTLSWRNFTYLMIKDKERPYGSLIRYTLDADIVTVYAVNAPLTEAWLEKKFPGTKNLRVVKSDYFHGLKVMLLDAATMDVLGDMPQDNWKQAGQFIKLHKAE